METIKKVCKKCGRELPQTKQYFYHRKNGRAHSVCKECLGFSFNKQPKDDYKFCSTCGKEKPKTEDYFARNARGYLISVCRVCGRQYAREYYADNKDRLTISRRIWSLENRDRIRQLRRKRYQANPEHFRAVKREWTLRHPNKNKEYYINNKEYYDKYREKNKDKISAYQKQYFKDHPNYWRGYRLRSKQIEMTPNDNVS